MKVATKMLEVTVNRWNGTYEQREDTNYMSESDEYQRFIGDPNVRPDPRMGAITSGAVYAIKRFAGDAGTEGGLLTNANGQVGG